MSEAMKGKVVVITGATSGIGQVAAESLAAMGARIVQIARDRERGEEAKKRLLACAPQLAPSVYYADLLRLSEIQRVAAEIAGREGKIDVLMNNAGAMFGSRELTEDGLERTFALNHMAYFVLTRGLRESLLACGQARVVNTSSDAHQVAALDMDDLQSAQAYQGGLWQWLRYGGPGFKVYGRSKLCNILFTRELSRRLVGTGVTANCLHPGFVDTRFGDQSGGLLSFGIRVGKRFALSPQQGAETLVYLASSPEVAGVTGGYFYRCRAATPSRDAQDDELALRLWTETARLAQVAD